MRIAQVPRRGTTKLHGRVIPLGEALRGPLTNAPCSFYAIDMLEWDNGVTYPFLRATSAAPLAIADDSGTAWVYPAGGMFTLRDAVSDTGNSVDNMRAVSAYVRQQGRSMTDRTGLARSISWTEKRLLPGDRIAVMGNIQWELGDQPSASYRDMPQRLTLRSARARPLVLSLLERAVAADESEG